MKLKKFLKIVITLMLVGITLIFASQTVFAAEPEQPEDIPAAEVGKDETKTPKKQNRRRNFRRT